MVGGIPGTPFRVNTFGELHGTVLGMVIDGCLAGLPLSTEEIQAYLNRRKPGRSAFTAPRKEADTYEIFSGVFGGKTLGTPTAALVRSKDQHLADYQAIWDRYRSGYADFGFDRKFGFRDLRGSDRSSGRETIGWVIGDAVAAKLLVEFSIRASAYASAVGAIEAAIFGEAICAGNLLGMPDPEAAAQAAACLKKVMQARDPLDGTVSCRVTRMLPGLGEPVFDKLDAELAKAVMSISAMKGVEFGDGFGVSTRCGSEDNDAFCPGQGGTKKKSDYAGGIFGGISDGSDILFRTVVKATLSIGSPQETVNKNGEPVTIETQGRCDPTIVPRAAVVVESVVNLVFADLLPRSSVSIVEKLKRAAGHA